MLLNLVNDLGIESNKECLVFSLEMNNNGPEFIAKKLRYWLLKLEVQPLYIEPGSPWEKALFLLSSTTYRLKRISNMFLKKCLTFLIILEQLLFVIGSIFGLYYLINLDVQFFAKSFGFVFIGFIIITYGKTNFKIFKNIKEVEIDSDKTSVSTNRFPNFDISVVKVVLAISLISFLFSSVLIFYEVFVDQISRYFPLKLITIVILYLAVNGSLQNLVERYK